MTGACASAGMRERGKTGWGASIPSLSLLFPHRSASPALPSVAPVPPPLAPRLTAALFAFFVSSMSGGALKARFPARFDFSVNDQENHQETYDNLREAMKKTHRMCAVVYDTHGPEITIFNSNNATVTMTAGSTVVLSGDKDQPVTANALPLACPELAKAVKPGDEVFVGRYLFTGSETTSVWLKVEEVKGDDIVCTVTNTAELQGEFFTVHAAQ
ncbi:unnamed protein product [Closterium sp. NIES-64]|nr:unnamed protein product [Closterium sp. NIES-64]